MPRPPPGTVSTRTVTQLDRSRLLRAASKPYTSPRRLPDDDSIRPLDDRLPCSEHRVLASCAVGLRRRTAGLERNPVPRGALARTATRAGPWPLSQIEFPVLTPVTNACHSAAEMTSAAASGAFESRTATTPGRLMATSTHWPLALLKLLLRHWARDRSGDVSRTSSRSHLRCG